MEVRQAEESPDAGLVLSGLRLERPVGGGRVLGHDGEGRVVMVEGGLPGEVVDVVLRGSRGRARLGEVGRVLEPVSGRVEPPCPEVARGCGGCDLQHASPALQRSMKVEVARDALRHLAGLRDVPVEPGADLPASGYRTTLRLAVGEGRVGFRHRRSHDVVPVGSCLVAHPALADLPGRIAPGHAREILLRTSVAENRTIAVVDPRRDDCVVPAGVRVVGRDRLRSGARVWLTEEVAGHRLRVGADSFFQSGPLGAAALGQAVARALEGFDADRDRLVDLYGGIGLFTVMLGARRSEVVERSSSAAADARRNTAAVGARVTRVAVGSWRPGRAEAVVADPPRAGLGRAGVEAVVSTGADRVALVSCDPAALGRDVGLFSDRGYRPVRVELVDQFAHTSHVEAVTSLVRAEGR